MDKVIEVKLPCGKVLKIELDRDLMLTEIEDKIFMLIEGTNVS